MYPAILKVMRWFLWVTMPLSFEAIPVSVAQADALAAPSCSRCLAGNTGQISSGMTGHLIRCSESAVVSKPSGWVEAGDDNGPLVAKRPRPSNGNKPMAKGSILDPDAPELDNGKVLPTLAGIHGRTEVAMSGISL